MARNYDTAPVICRGFVIFECVMPVYDFSSFAESGSGKRVAINPHLVRFVIEINDKTVAIVFDQLHQINVDGTVASIAEHLRKTVR